MKKTKKILCPTDFSEPSANAFRYALLLADHLEASIEVVHATLPIVADALPYSGYSGATTDVMIKGLKEQTEEFVKLGITQVLEQLHNAPFVTTNVLLGTTVQDIVLQAKKDDVDFILMGSRGKNKSMLDKLLGSTAAGVVENAECPVIVIPEHATFQANMNLAYATDLSVADPFEIWKTVQLLSPLEPNIRVVHIRLPKEKPEVVENKMEELETFFTQNHPDTPINFHTIPGLNLQKELDTFTTIYKTDMMVMFRPHHSLWSKLFLKSNTKDSVINTQLPLLVQKEKKRKFEY